MLIRYRNYDFTFGPTTFRHQQTPVFNEQLQRESVAVRVEIDCELLVPNTTPDAQNAATLVAYKRRIMDAFSVDGGDFVATHPTGEEELRIRSSELIGGLRVVEGPSFMDNPPGELVRRRTCKIVLAGEKGAVEASILLGAGGPIVVSSVQSFRYEGTGGRRTVIVETMEGDPIVQQVNARTKCTCIQSGSLVQRFFQPSPPAPRYPALEKEDLRVIVPGNPAKETYSVDWTYVFESATPFRN